MAFFKVFCKDERGATAIEYGLMSALIALVMLGGLSAMSKSLNTQYENIADAAGGEAPGTPRPTGRWLR